MAPGTRDRLTAAVASLVRAGRQVSSRAAAQFNGDLPSYGWALLQPLQRDGDLRSTDLAARVGVDVSVVSRQLAVLERSGYIERHPDPRDGRASLLRITPAGEDALAAARGLRSEWALSAFSHWDETDAQLLVDLLDRLVDDLAAVAQPRSAVPTPR
jgi:DNA-binding MarR family transcriptional regulator